MTNNDRIGQPPMLLNIGVQYKFRLKKVQIPFEKNKFHYKNRLMIFFLMFLI